MAMLLAGCAIVHPLACRSAEERLVQDALFFGTARPAGVVTPEEWADFLQGTVTPRFPQGLTAWPASGQWRGQDGTIVREGSYVLTLVHPDDAIHERAVRDVVAAYKARFQQEAVLRVRTNACASF